MPPKRKKTDKVVKKEEEEPKDEEMNDETKEEKPKEEPVKGEETKDESKEEQKDETKEDNGGKEDAKADDGKKDGDKKETADDDKKQAVKEEEEEEEEEEEGEDKEKEETKNAVKKEDDADVKKEDSSKDESKKDDESDEESDDKDDKKRKREEDEGTPIGKRARKSHTTVAYQPDDFTEKKVTVHIPDGRGDKLKDIPSVKASIEKMPINSDVFGLAYRFLFAPRGKMNRKVAKAHMLDFCGYLPVQDDDMSDTKKEKEDEEMETKYSKKAYKLTVPQLKNLCDLFDVDRHPGPEEKVDKDVLIDRLLDFLSAPSVEYTNAAKKKESKQGDTKKSAEKKKPAGKKKIVKKKASKKADESDEEVDDAEESEEEHKEGDLPSDKQLRKWVKAYVACHNMNTATTKHALEVASSKFGVDMKPKKKTIKMFLTEEC